MSLLLFAQPYNIDATGFPFDSAAAFETRQRNHRDRYGQPVEEYEIQFIDGSALNAELFEALSINQVTLARFFEVAEAWDDDDKRRVILAAAHCGCRFDLAKDEPGDLDLDVYELDSLIDLAAQFIDDGLLGPIPDALAPYIDQVAFARDLACDYAEACIAGTRLVYRRG